MNYYNRYINQLLKGRVTSPRGMEVSFLENVTIAVPYGTTYRREKDNPMIGFMEGLQFIVGTFDFLNIQRIAPHARLDLFGKQSAYGRRTHTQLPKVIQALSDYPDTRQAVLILAEQDEPLGERPCTTAIQFVRDHFTNTLNAIVTMRSSDAVWGLPNDMIQFSMILKCVASCVGMVPNKVIINIGHAHIYHSTLHLAKGYTEWTFCLPEYLTLKLWQDWAWTDMKRTNMEYVTTLFAFREVPE